eukprot:COSAG02_NODE_2063_length_9965_cov_116.411920_9_plen_125_part_00
MNAPLPALERRRNRGASAAAAQCGNCGGGEVAREGVRDRDRDGGHSRTRDLLVEVLGVELNCAGVSAGCQHGRGQDGESGANEHPLRSHPSAPESAVHHGPPRATRTPTSIPPHSRTLRPSDAR